MTTENLIKAVEQADSADGLLEAVEALAAAKNTGAIPTLVDVLGFNNPGASVAAVEGLIDIGEPVVPYLLESLDEYNYGARAWAIRVFAGIGDPRALHLLLQAAKEDFSLSVRRAAAKGLGTIQWSKLSPEETQKAQREILNTLLVVCQDGEWVVRYAAIVALESLLKTVENFELEIKDIFQEMLENESELAIKARIQFALE